VRPAVRRELDCLVNKLFNMMVISRDRRSRSCAGGSWSTIVWSWRLPDYHSQRRRPNAKWELRAETTVVARRTATRPRPAASGFVTTAFPITPAMTFVEEKYQVVALFHQNELQLVEEGTRPSQH